MKKKFTKIKGLVVIKGVKFNDNRGYFREIHKKKMLKNIDLKFWCMSKSKKGVLRRNVNYNYLIILKLRIAPI